MIVRPLSHSDLRAIFRRREQIERHQPRCACHSDQVQIISKAIPAKWKCRRCKAIFTSEPTVDVGQAQGSGK